MKGESIPFRFRDNVELPNARTHLPRGSCEVHFDKEPTRKRPITFDFSAQRRFRAGLLRPSDPTVRTPSQLSLACCGCPLYTVRSLKTQQCTLAPQATPVPAECSVTPYNAVTRDNDGHTIVPVGTPYRPLSARPTDLPGQPFVRKRMSVRDLAQAIPHRPFRYSLRRCQRF